MNDKNEFDLDFDFEKEYGISPDFMAEPEFDEDDLLTEFLNEDLPEPEEADSAVQQDAYQEPLSQETPEEEPIPDDFLDNLDDILRGITDEDTDVPEEPLYTPEEPPYTPEEETAILQESPALPLEPIAEEIPQPQLPEEPIPAAPPISRAELRRIQRAKKRKFKEVYLPAIIGSISLVLMLVFIFGAVTRGIANRKAEEQAALDASKAAEDAATALDQEADRLLAEAKLLAAGYNYQAAIDVLDSFSGEQTSYPELLSAKASYSQSLTQVKAWSDPSEITNLSFHVLIADPARAFTDRSYGNAYNKNFVTIDEFQKILEQLYNNGYVLVDLDDIITETTAADGTVTYSANTIYLPADKTPIMLTETMVNYFNYMIDGDDDGKADAQGGGFASRLVIDGSGDIKAEMVTSTGETVVGDYDLVPILESFIEEHPDFSYQGARAILAVCGKEGVFGYRTNTGDQTEIDGATQIVEALREQGYTIACYTYDNLDYNAATVSGIQADLQSWFNEVQPVLGKVDVMVYARHVDISDYTGSKYNVLYSSGFRYFIGASTAPWAEVTNDYFHQKRLLVTGTQMAYASSTFSAYFNSMAILNDQRGTVPN